MQLLLKLVNAPPGCVFECFSGAACPDRGNFVGVGRDNIFCDRIRDPSCSSKLFFIGDGLRATWMETSN